MRVAYRGFPLFGAETAKSVFIDSPFSRLARFASSRAHPDRLLKCVTFINISRKVTILSLLIIPSNLLVALAFFMLVVL